MADIRSQPGQGKTLPPPSIDTWGTVGHLTEQQQEALTIFLSNVSEADLQFVKFKIESNENAALRFLRARNFQVSNSIQLVQDAVKRRIDGNAVHHAAATHPDQCTQCDTEALKKFYPHTQFGYDRFNRPILFEQSGAVDANAIYQMTTMENLIAYHWYSMDTTLNQMFEVASQQGPLTISTCVILDLTGLNSHHGSSKVVDHVKSLVALDNICYPELLGKMFVINAPWLAVTMWEMVKSWLDVRTQQKIEILGSGPETTQRLLQFISPENLPILHGGVAANLFKPREHTEFVHIPRSGVIKKLIQVPQHKKLVIESYVTEGEIGFEVYTRRVPNTHQQNHHHHHQNHSSTATTNYESLSNSEWNRYLSAHSKEWRLFMKTELKNNHLNQDKNSNPSPRPPFRSSIEILSVHEGTSNEYIVLWINSAMFYTRPLVFNLLFKDSESSSTTAAIISPAASPMKAALSHPPTHPDEIRVEGL